jgi:hypothetical protein
MRQCEIGTFSEWILDSCTWEEVAWMTESITGWG